MQEIFWKIKKKEIHDINYSESEGDSSNFVQCLTIMAKVKTGNKDLNEQDIKGILVFAEELVPEIIKITKRIRVKRYKPYESFRLGKYNSRFWGEGYREIGRPYQNRANELGNQIRKIMKLAMKILFLSDDQKLAGKNMLSSLEDGQVLNLSKGSMFQVLNNVFPNLSIFAEEWNRNINECEKALKSFEVATGESLPSSTSATAISVQNQAIGSYYGFMREKFGLFLAVITKRWVIPEMKNLDPEEMLEIIGDPSYMDEIITAYAKGWVINNALKATAGKGILYKEDFENLVEVKKQELLSQPKLYVQITKDFFKNIDFYVGVNTTGEPFNKQARVSNILAMLNYELNPNLANNPEAQSTLNEVRQLLGLNPVKFKPKQQENPVNMGMTSSQTPQVPQKEPSLAQPEMSGVL